MKRIQQMHKLLMGFTHECMGSYRQVHPGKLQGPHNPVSSDVLSELSAGIGEPNNYKNMISNMKNLKDHM